MWPRQKKASPIELPATNPQMVGFYHQHLYRMRNSLADRNSINQAVYDMSTIIVNPHDDKVPAKPIDRDNVDVNAPANVNKGDLLGILNQFNNKGKRKPDATFKYYASSRAKTERRNLSPVGVSQLEKLVAVSVYFQAGSDLKKNRIEYKNIDQHADHIRDYVACLLKNNFDMGNKPTELKVSLATNKAINAVISMDKCHLADLELLYDKAQDRIKELQKSIIVDTQKLKIYENFCKAFDNYCKTGDMNKFKQDIGVMENLDEKRIKGFSKIHQTSDFVKAVSKAAKDHSIEAEKLNTKLLELKSPNAVAQNTNRPR